MCIPRLQKTKRQLNFPAEHWKRYSPRICRSMLRDSCRNFLCQSLNCSWGFGFGLIKAITFSMTQPSADTGPYSHRAQIATLSGKILEEFFYSCNHQQKNILPSEPLVPALKAQLSYVQSNSLQQPNKLNEPPHKPPQQSLGTPIDPQSESHVHHNARLPARQMWGQRNLYALAKAPHSKSNPRRFPRSLSPSRLSRSTKNWHRKKRGLAASPIFLQLTELCELVPPESSTIAEFQQILQLAEDRSRNSESRTASSPKAVPSLWSPNRAKPYNCVEHEWTA